MSAAVTWHRWAASLGSLGAGDVASLDGFVGSVGGGGCVDEPAPAWPNAGSRWGAQRRQWRPRVVVDGGGIDERDGMVTMCDIGDVSTAVARFGNSRASIINQC